MVKNLAIVIPYFKIEFFDSCLDSLVRQTSKDFKVYIGDDNSPNSPTDILEKYNDQLNISYKKFDHNLGSSSLVDHWNRCIEMAEGEEWLMILGDDDKLGPDCVQNFVQVKEDIRKSNINVVRFATIKIDQNEQEISGKFVHPEKENSVDFLFRKLRGNTRSSLSEYIFKKRTVDLLKFKKLPLAWHTDDLAILEFSKFGNVYSINSAIVYFRNSGINISTLTSNLREKNKASFLFYYKLLKEYRSYFGKNERKILIHRLEKAFLNDKKNIRFYAYYYALRMNHLEFSDLAGFSLRLISSISRGGAMKRFIG